MKLMYLLAVSLLLFGCAGFGGTLLKALNEEPGKYVGERITVSGTVEDSVKLGQISGYTLTNEGYSIRVSSQSLPAEGSKITVTGTWMHDTLFGYYLLVGES